MIFSAGENPGLISDVFVVREEFLAEKPGQVVALLKAWDAALADYRADTDGGRAIIAEAVGAKPEELATAFDGVVYYSLAENKTELAGRLHHQGDPRGQGRGAQGRDPARRTSTSPTAIDGRFVDAATQMSAAGGGRRARSRSAAAHLDARDYRRDRGPRLRCASACVLVGGHRGRPGAAALPALARRRCCRRLGELRGRRASSPPMSASASTGSASAS